MAEARGPGRPVVEGDEKKVSFSASVRLATAQMVDFIVKVSGEQKGALIERLVDREYQKVMASASLGTEIFREWLLASGVDSVVIANVPVFVDQHPAIAIDTGELVIHATDRALYHLGKSKRQEEELLSAQDTLRQMLQFGTKLARFDFIDGMLRFATPESVVHAIELNVGQPVRVWTVPGDQPGGQHHPWVGVLRSRPDFVYLEPIDGLPSFKNGSGLIPKLNIVEIERIR